MGDKKISELVSASNVNPTDSVPIVQASQTKKAAASLFQGAIMPDWLTSTVYAVGNLVTKNYAVYFCVTAHTSGTWATDLAAGKWAPMSSIPGYYEGRGSYLNGNALTLNPCVVDLDGRLFNIPSTVIKADVTTGLSASTWYVGLINESTGAVSYTTVATQSSWTGHTLASNLLNLSNIYSDVKKYNAVNDGANYYRAMLIFKVNAAGNGLEYLIDIPHRVKSYAKYSSNASITVNNSTPKIVDYEDVVIDYNNDCSVGASWVFTARSNGIHRIYATFYWPNVTGFAASEQVDLRISLNGAAGAEYLDFYYFANSPTTNPYIYQKGSIEIFLKEGDTISILATQNSGGNLTFNNGAVALTRIEIRET